MGDDDFPGQIYFEETPEAPEEVEPVVISDDDLNDDDGEEEGGEGAVVEGDPEVGVFLHQLLLDRLEQQLGHRGATVLRFAKPTFTKPAPADLRHEIATQCEAVIEALAD